MSNYVKLCYGHTLSVILRSILVNIEAFGAIFQLKLVSNLVLQRIF